MTTDVNEDQQTSALAEEGGDTQPSQPKTASKPKRFLIGFLKKFVIISLMVYLAILAALIYNETALVYPGSKYPRGNWEPEFAFEEVEFKAEDGTQLYGWFLPRNNDSDLSNEVSSNQETILICHGNGENVAQCSAYYGDKLRNVLNADVFVFDYRSFGKSEGKPTESNVLSDAELALEWLCDKTGRTKNEVTLVGHSLGGGPSCYLAGKYGCKSLILQRTFSSLVNAAEHNYPIFPVRWLMKNQFLSDERIADYDGPLFHSHGTADKLIPFEHGKDLFEACPSTTKQFVGIDGMGHFDDWPESYWVQLRKFYDENVWANK